jgi:hypothetical protein
MTFSHRLSADLSVFEMDENEGGAGEVAESAGARGSLLEHLF